MIKKIVFFGLISLLFANCKTTQLVKKINKTFDASFYDNQFTGLLIYNPATKDTIVSYNADKYFTPASNTKIITLFTALKMLPNKIPAFKYAIEKDTITLLGTGNPAFLHTFFNDSTALQMVKKYQKVKIVVNNFSDDKFAPGWAWEDYDRYFSTELSAFPMYGNVLTIHKTADSLHILPSKMNATITSDKKFRRKYNENVFYYPSKRNDTLEIPMEGRDPLRIQVILASRVFRTANGDVPYYSYYAYWFVGQDHETPSHYTRMFWLAWDRVMHSKANRWAYIAVSGQREPEGNEYETDLIDLVQKIYPQLLTDEMKQTVYK